MMCHQWQIQGRGPGGEWPGGPGPPLFLDQTEGQKNILGRPDPRAPSLSKGLDDWVPSLPPLSQGLDLALATTCT